MKTLLFPSLHARMRAVLPVFQLFLAFFILTGTVSGSEQVSLNLDDPQARAQFLIELNQLIPSLLFQSSAYELDLQTSLDRIQTVQNYFSNKGIQSPPAHQGPWLELRIGRSQSQSAAGAPDSALLEKRLDTMSALIRKFSSSGRSMESIVMRSLEGLPVQGIASLNAATLQFIPAADRGTFAQAPADQKVTYLEKLAKSKNREAESQLISRVNVARLGFKTQVEIRSIKDFAKIYKNALDAELKAIGAIQVQAFRLKSGKKGFPTRKDLGQLTAEDVSAALASFTVEKEAQKLLDSLRSRAAIEKHKKESTIVPEVILREMPPYYGVFRGVVGADCASSYSFVYPFSTAERTFFVYDPASLIPLGYLQATEVEVNGSGSERRLYLHDVSGPRLSITNLEASLYGLAKYAETSGLHGLILPTQGRLESNVNFYVIRTYLEKLIDQLKSKESKLELTYPDNELRKTLAEVIPGTNNSYDLNSANRNGYAAGELARKSPARGGEFVFEESNWNIKDLLKSRQSIATSGLALALALEAPQYSRNDGEELDLMSGRVDGGAQRSSHSGEEQLIKSALSISGISIKEFRSLIKKIYASPKSGGFEVRRMTLIEALEELFVSDSAPKDRANEMLSQYPHLFAEYLLQGGVSREEWMKDRPLIRELTLNSLRLWTHPQSLSRMFDQLGREILSDSEIKRYVRGLVSNDEAKILQLQWLLESGLDAAVLVDLLGELQSISELHKRATSHHGWVNQLREVIRIVEEKIDQEGVDCAHIIDPAA